MRTIKLRCDLSQCNVLITGTMILWPLLYLACEQHLRCDIDEKGNHKFLNRFFPFASLWGNDQGRPEIYSRPKLVELIQRLLLGTFPKESPDRMLFEKICHICGFMCAHDPKERKIVPDISVSATEQCLNFLDFAPKMTIVAAPRVDSTFDPVCKFIDNFCASGHFRGSAKVLKKTARWREIRFQFADFGPRTVEYESSPERNWLFVNRKPGRVPDGSFKEDDCLTPDYCVLPPQEFVFGDVQPRAIFLPRNKFCSGMDSSTSGMFDPAFLTLLTQRDWFTVFRYERPNHSPWIIKSVMCMSALMFIFNSPCPDTLALIALHSSICFRKRSCSGGLLLLHFIVQNKASLTLGRYLQHPRIANEIEDYQDFHPLVMFTEIDQSSESENPFTGNDRFVIYEDGGRPMDILLTQCGWRPSVEIVKRITAQLLEALAYLFSKRVVHRKLELGSVVFSLQTLNVKLISLGEAKYIEPLDYEKKVSDFEREWHWSSDQVGRKRSTRSASPPPRPQLSLPNSIMCMHPSLRCSA
jgi:hypothetical protein